MIGFPRFLRDGAVLSHRDHSFIDLILVGMEHGLFPIGQRNIGPECLATVTTPIAHMECNDLARSRIHRNPDPLFVRFLLHEAPRLIGLRFQVRQQDSGGLGGTLHMQVIRTGRKAFYHKVQQPRETHTDRTADATEGDPLAQQLGNPLALLGRNVPISGGRCKLAAACFTLMILLPVAGVAIFLVLVRSTRGARVADEHGAC